MKWKAGIVGVTLCLTLISPSGISAKKNTQAPQPQAQAIQEKKKIIKLSEVEKEAITLAQKMGIPRMRIVRIEELTETMEKMGLSLKPDRPALFCFHDRLPGSGLPALYLVWDPAYADEVVGIWELEEMMKEGMKRNLRSLPWVTTQTVLQRAQDPQGAQKSNETDMLEKAERGIRIFERMRNILR